MARGPRIDFPGARHHVMNRGARKAPIFGEPDARDLFVEVLSELPGRFGVDVHSYVVLPNHFHLLLGTPRGNLSRAMRHLGALFTQRLNSLRGWDGPVLRGRFKNRVCMDPQYWRYLLVYLHLNPVPSVVEKPEDWAWSSYRAYAGLDPAPAWLTTAQLLHDYGSRREILAVTEYHRSGRWGPPDGFDAERLWDALPSEVLTPQPDDMDARPLLAHQALGEVSELTGSSEELLCTARRGRHDNRARWVAAWWLTRRAALTQREAGRYLGCRASSVANMLLRLRHRLEAGEDAELAGWVAALEERARGGERKW